MATGDRSNQASGHSRVNVLVVAIAATLLASACAAGTAPTSGSSPVTTAVPTSTPHPEPTIPISPALESSANLITNGRFEQPVAKPQSSSDELPTLTSLPGWAMAGGVGLDSGALDPGYPPLDGSQYLVLAGTVLVRTPGEVSQRVHTVPGDTYRLTFLEGSIPQYCVVAARQPGGAYVIDVTWNGTKVLGLSSTPVRSSKSNPEPSGQAWHTVADSSLVATTTITRISFAGGVGCGVAFDDVILQQAPPVFAGTVVTPFTFKDATGNVMTVSFIGVIYGPQGTADISPGIGYRWVGAKFEIVGISGTSSGDANADAALIPVPSDTETYSPDVNGVITGCPNFNVGRYKVTAGQTSFGCVVFRGPWDDRWERIEWHVGFGGAPAIWPVPEPR